MKFNSRNTILKIELQTETHSPNLIAGNILTKIIEEREKCAAVVLKLIDMFLHKNSPTIVELLVYRFLQNRICKHYELNNIKKMIRKSNPRQKMIDEVKEIHFFTSKSYEEYSEYSNEIVHCSMNLHPISQEIILKKINSPNKLDKIQVKIPFYYSLLE